LRDFDGSQPEDAAAGPPNRLAPERIKVLHDQWAPDVRAFLWGLTRNPEQSEELLQATFARLVEAGHAVNESAVRGWLFKVAHNEAMLWRRKTAIHERAIQKIIPVHQCSNDNPPWTKLLRAEEAERVRRALKALPQEQKYVVEQRIYADKTFADIAGQLGVPIGTVLTRMRLALAKLQNALRTTLSPIDE